MSIHTSFEDSTDNATIQQGMDWKRKSKRARISLFGHFGAANFGNESTLQATLCHVRRLVPGAEITCICTAPDIVAADYEIATVPMSAVLVTSWNTRNPLARWMRKLVIGIPSEIYRWITGVMTLRNTDALIITGTGLLNDAFSIAGWGPYSTFKWSVIAKVCRCKLVFLSIGAGPLHRPMGRFLVKWALFLADFRSYRDRSTLQYLNGIGFQSSDDPIYPDLAFSLPPALLPHGRADKERRLVVGIGLMEHAGMYGGERPNSAGYAAYLETLVGFVNWLLNRGHNVRLLLGDLADVPTSREFESLLRERSLVSKEERIVAEPIASAHDLLTQLAATDFVVGTRFHNLVLALLLNKPSIAISFHHKCSSLMSQMGLSEYCQGIKELNATRLIEQFCSLEKNAETLRHIIRDKVSDCRAALDEQYAVVFKDMIQTGVSDQVRGKRFSKVAGQKGG